MVEQLLSREKVTADARHALELADDLKVDQAGYSDDELLQISDFLSRFFLDISKRLADHSALLEFQIESGMV